MVDGSDGHAVTDALPYTDAEALWARFVAACGEDEIAQCYRGAIPVPRERVWQVQADGIEVAWFSLIPDPVSPSVASRSGVFPAFRRRGIWRTMLEEIRLTAFEDPMIQAVRARVLLSNADNAARMIGLTQTLPWYAFDGISLHPPAYHIITTREAWEAR